jgi:CDP-4-dehydro-6-deoxyglucose reductase
MRPCVVSIEDVDRSFECGDQYVLDAALTAGLELPYSCRGGACGTCKAQILEGAVEHGWVMGFAISDAEVAQGRCLVCSCKPKTDRLRLRMLNPPRHTPHLDHAPGEYDARILGISDLTPSVRLLTVQLPQKVSFVFAAGMYMELLVDAIVPARPYSIVTTPTPEGSAPDGVLAFLIGRHDRGASSQYLHSRVCVGDMLRIRGPYGTFRLGETAPGKVLMLAGGTGLAPLIAIAEEALRAGSNSMIELLFSVRTQRDVFFICELNKLAARHANFHYRLFVTRGASDNLPPDWSSGRITATPGFRGALVDAQTVLVAGSPGFVEACHGHAVEYGVAAEAIVVEAYVPKAVRRGDPDGQSV